MSTSAEDISIIYRAAFRNKTFARIVDTEHVEFPGWGELPTNNEKLISWISESVELFQPELRR